MVGVKRGSHLRAPCEGHGVENVYVSETYAGRVGWRTLFRVARLAFRRRVQTALLLTIRLRGKSPSRPSIAEADAGVCSAGAGLRRVAPWPVESAQVLLRRLRIEFGAVIDEPDGPRHPLSRSRASSQFLALGEIEDLLPALTRP